MPSTKNTTSLPATPPSNANSPHAAAPDEAPSWRRAREHLEQAKVRIAGQINAYPPPIPACDAQFNYLLEQRGKISEELNRLEAARRESVGQERGGHEKDGQATGRQNISGQALHEFIESSEFIDEADARKIVAE